MSTALPLIFDLDGTLVDSLPDLHAAVNRLLASEGHAPLSIEEVRGFVGDGAAVLVQRVMNARSIDPERHAELTSRMLADYEPRSAELTKVYPHVTETLAELQRIGHRLGICTNKPAAATRTVLTALGLDFAFETVIAGDTLAERKPHPAPLLAACRELGGIAIYVGDSEVDARTADAAGLKFLLYTEGYLRVPMSEINVTATFRDFRELPRLVSRVAVDA